ncbi:prepilin peptidase [Pseudomonas akapageensis]|uniref:prepilin peptidase n=1 Tax=Pseudomonas akapageensis TaxID=2609961 RepID=UPI001409A93F|nr:prepilin peptidase [Pseudomonas akapageensis]
MQSLVLLLWLALCAEQDVRQRQIANELTLGGAVCALIYLFLTGHTWLGADATEGGWALAIVILLSMPGYVYGQLGAGDVKLLGALALATDRMHILGTIIGAGLVTVLWLMSSSWLVAHVSQRFKTYLLQLNGDSSKKQPFAPFLLAGFFIALLWVN